MDSNNIGKRLTEAREKKSLTQLQAADLVGISERSLQGHEANEHRPSDNTIKRYAHIYKRSRFYLLTGEIDHVSEGIPLYQKSKSELQDGEGPWGKTRRRDVEGTHLTITEFEPKNGQMKGPLRAAMEGLGEIFDSNNPILIPAIQANIRAFQLSARRERQNIQQSQKIKDLEDKCDEIKDELDSMKEIVTTLKKKMEENPSSGPAEEPTKKKVM